MIELKNITIGYKTKRIETVVYSNINELLNLGELVGLIGDNGVGKSTLIKTITGNLEVLSGEVFIQSNSIKRYSAIELAKLISIVTTEKIGGFNLTAWDVVATGRTPYVNTFGTLTGLDEQIVTTSLDKLSILHLKTKLIDELSDGQRQKVMIAKSLAQQTPVIILDEPTAFLDYKSKHQLFETLKYLCEKENKLILVSSHDLDLMNKYIARSICLT